MKTFYIKAEPHHSGAPPAIAIVVAKDAHHALLLLKQDTNFSGYRMPPAEMTPFEATNDHLQRVLGDAVAHETGVYGFTTLGEAEPAQAGAPPETIS